jgi:hypothetical protein
MVTFSQIKLISWIDERSIFKICMIGRRISWKWPHSGQYDEVEEIPLPTLEEVNFALLKLKNSRASGPDGLNAELLKVIKMDLINRFLKLIEKIWKEEIFPGQWEEGLIRPIYKQIE